MARAVAAQHQILRENDPSILNNKEAYLARLYGLLQSEGEAGEWLARDFIRWRLFDSVRDGTPLPYTPPSLKGNFEAWVRSIRAEQGTEEELVEEHFSGEINTRPTAAVAPAAPTNGNREQRPSTGNNAAGAGSAASAWPLLGSQSTPDTTGQRLPAFSYASIVRSPSAQGPKEVNKTPRQPAAASDKPAAGVLGSASTAVPNANTIQPALSSPPLASVESRPKPSSFYDSPHTAGPSPELQRSISAQSELYRLPDVSPLAILEQRNSAGSKLYGSIPSGSTSNAAMYDTPDPHFGHSRPHEGQQQRDNAPRHLYDGWNEPGVPAMLAGPQPQSGAPSLPPGAPPYSQLPASLPQPHSGPSLVASASDFAPPLPDAQTTTRVEAAAVLFSTLVQDISFQSMDKYQRQAEAIHRRMLELSHACGINDSHLEWHGKDWWLLPGAGVRYRQRPKSKEQTHSDTRSLYDIIGIKKSSDEGGEGGGGGEGGPNKEEEGSGGAPVLSKQGSASQRGGWGQPTVATVATSKGSSASAPDKLGVAASGPPRAVKGVWGQPSIGLTKPSESSPPAAAATSPPHAPEPLVAAAKRRLSHSGRSSGGGSRRGSDSLSIGFDSDGSEGVTRDAALAEEQSEETSPHSVNTAGDDRWAANASASLPVYQLRERAPWFALWCQLSEMAGLRLTRAGIHTLVCLAEAALEHNPAIHVDEKYAWESKSFLAVGHEDLSEEAWEHDPGLPLSLLRDSVQLRRQRSRASTVSASTVSSLPPKSPPPQGIRTVLSESSGSAVWHSLSEQPKALRLKTRPDSEPPRPEGLSHRRVESEGFRDNVSSPLSFGSSRSDHSASGGGFPAQPVLYAADSAVSFATSYSGADGSSEVRSISSQWSVATSGDDDGITGASTTSGLEESRLNDFADSDEESLSFASPSHSSTHDGLAQQAETVTAWRLQLTQMANWRFPIEDIDVRDPVERVKQSPFLYYAMGTELLLRARTYKREAARRFGDMSKEMFDKALALSNTDPETLTNFSFLMTALFSNFHAAEYLLKLAIRANPDFVRAHYYMALLYQRDLKSPEKANRAFRRALEVMLFALLRTVLSFPHCFALWCCR